MEQQNPFPLSEYERRLGQVRQGMAGRGLDALVLTAPENVFYLTGYQTFGSAQQFLVVPLDGEPLFVLRELESYLVSYTSWLQAVRIYGDSGDPVAAIVEALQASGLGGKTVGLEEESRNLPVKLHRRLLAEAGSIRFVDGYGIVEACRVVKSALEIEMCRRAAEFTSAGMLSAIEAVRAGNSENEVAGAAFKAIAEAGSEWLAVDPIVTSGPRSGVPHTSYAGRKLEPGDSVLIELSGCHNRYYGPLMRSCTVGTARPEVQRMHDACVEALEAAMAAIRPGVTSGEVHGACQRVIDRYGYTENFRKRLGYAVGIGFKSWMEAHIFDLKAGDERWLQAGMVFHMPPALRQLHQYGVGVSETVVVTDGGCERLGRLPRELFRR
jgi:Xaa-Pro dipeptidase